MRVAIIHYWLVAMRGGERVLERICQLYPDADIFTHVYDPQVICQSINRHKVHVSFIQHLPASRRLYRSYLPLMPVALESLDLSRYDLVISSEAGPAKGVIPAPDSTHLSYCHSPMRYIWDQFHVYQKTAGPVTRSVWPWISSSLRGWDTNSSARVDHFVANSSFVRDRIRKYYRRNAEVIHPPVPVNRFRLSQDVGPEFLWVGQLVPYKRADLVIEAFNELGFPIRIVGTGQMAKSLRARAKPNIRFEAHLSLEALAEAYARCRALIFTAEEDFGIVPVEVNASGRPVIALGRGGVRETMIPGRTALFYPEPTVEALVDAIERFAIWERDFVPGEALANAQRFRPEVFDAKFQASVERAVCAKTEASASALAPEWAVPAPLYSANAP